MSEIEFFNAVVTEADCDVLLDLNNIYVNSVNHNYDAEEFLQAIPSQRISYAHIAGHYVEAENFLVDTYGAEVIDPVWELLGKAYHLLHVTCPKISDLMRGKSGNLSFKRIKPWSAPYILLLFQNIKKPRSKNVVFL